MTFNRKWRGLRGAGLTSVAVTTTAIVAMTALPAAAAAPTNTKLRSALLTQSQMTGWYRDSLPAPGRKTFCNVDRHVNWQSYAGAYFSSKTSSAELDEGLIGYSSSTWARKAFLEVRHASYACASYSIGNGFTIRVSHVSAPNLGAGAFALRTKQWNGVGAPWYCLRVVVRYRQVNHADGFCNFTQPSRHRAMTLIRKAYNTAVGRL
jgi:hypothetical protein